MCHSSCSVRVVCCVFVCDTSCVLCYSIDLGAPSGSRVIVGCCSASRCCVFIASDLDNGEVMTSRDLEMPELSDIPIREEEVFLAQDEDQLEATMPSLEDPDGVGPHSQWQGSPLTTGQGGHRRKGSSNPTSCKPPRTWTSSSRTRLRNRSGLCHEHCSPR